MINNAEGRPKSYVKTAREIIGLQIPIVPKLLAPILPKTGVVSLAGSSDVGKSYLLLQLADAIIKGEKNFLGFELEVRHKAAIYLSTEDDDNSLCPRLMKLSKECSDLKIYDSLRVLYETVNLVERIDKLLQESPVDVVVIDTFADVYPGDMNQVNQVRGFIQQFKELATRHETLIIFNHHCGKKNDTRPPHKDNLLGSQGFESSMRIVLELRKDLKNPNIRHLCVVKGNYIGEECKNSSYALDFSFENGFSNTGIRVSFDKLIKENKSNRITSEIEEEIRDMIIQGYTVDEIHETLIDMGIDVSRATVGNKCQKIRPSISKSIEDKMDGQDLAA